MATILERQLQKREEEHAQVDKKVNSSNIHATAEEREMLDRLVVEISAQYRDELASQATNRAVLDKKIEATIQEKTQALDLPYENRKRIERLAKMNIIGLGPIQPFLKMPEVTEIVVQRYDNVCVEIKGQVRKVDASFSDEANLRNVINRILQPVSRQINLATPIVDARLSDGSRVCATIPPVSPKGATLTIRKFQNEKMTAQEYVKLRTATPEMISFLRSCVMAKLSMFVSGGTGTGKTTLLNILSSFLPNNELIVTIEDTLELQLKQDNVRSLETRQGGGDSMMQVDMSALVKASLRMRPDTIICGEVRDQAVVEFLNAASTGHEGSMCTAHANSPENLVNVRVPIMMSRDKNAGFSEESRALQISEAVQMIVQLKRLRGGRRVISRITAVNGVKNSRVNLTDVYVYDEEHDVQNCTWQLPQYIYDRFKAYDVRIDPRFEPVPNVGFV